MALTNAMKMKRLQLVVNSGVNLVANWQLLSLPLHVVLLRFKGLLKEYIEDSHDGFLVRPREAECLFSCESEVALNPRRTESAEHHPSQAEWDRLWESDSDS